jgi:hypothetical protein
LPRRRAPATYSGHGRLPAQATAQAGVVDPVTGELVPFPYLRHPRAGLSNVQWRALSPGEKVERLLNMPLDRAAEILTWPLAELDPLRLSLRMQVSHIVFMIGMKAMREGKLGRERAPLRAPDPALEKLLLRLRARLLRGRARDLGRRYGEAPGHGAGG